MSPMLTGGLIALAGVAWGYALQRLKMRNPFRRTYSARKCPMHGLFHREQPKCLFCGESMELIRVVRVGGKHKHRRNPACCPPERHTEWLG